MARTSAQGKNAVGPRQGTALDIGLSQARIGGRAGESDLGSMSHDVLVVLLVAFTALLV